jgi:hypothetical protein
MIILMILSVGWPLAPQNQTQPLGNNWGEYQDYGGSPYLHPGIDVMGITVWRPVYAVQRGFVKAWLTTSGEWHWRLAIADTNLTTDSVEAWLYAHIDSNQYHKNVGDVVNAGDLIGYLVEWPIVGFDHCHFARIKDIGAVWNNADWAFVQNPLMIITPYADTAKPVFENAYSGNKFALCVNNTSTYINPNNVTGSIDIIAKIYDKTGLPLPVNPVWEEMIPLRITYEIHGPQNVPNRLSFVFKGVLNWDNTTIVNVIHKDDATCNTRGDYDYRDFYFIVTNTDGDSIVESSDATYSWNTSGFPAGHYWIVVTASDAANNVTIDSMEVIIQGTEVAENTEEDSRAEMLLPTLNRNIPRMVAQDAQIYDINGRTITRERVTSGVYFVVRENKGKRQVQKIVVIK